MEESIREIASLSEQKAETYRYWQSKTPAERVAETWRLSVEKYGEPKVGLRDGPLQRIRRNANAEEEVVELTYPSANEVQPKT
jgi:hypothetical protein